MTDDAPRAAGQGVEAGTSRSAGPGATLAALLGLTGFAISQPLLAVLGDEPSFFAFRNIEGRALVWFALTIAVLPPVVAWVAVMAVRAVSVPAGRVVHLAMVGALVGLAVLQLLARSDVDSAALSVVVALAVAGAATSAYERVPAVALWTRYTAVLPFLAAGLFLTVSDASDLLEPPERVVAAVDASGDYADLPSVVMIVLDELPTMSLLDPDGGIDAVRYPALATFSDDATWYRDFTTTASFTEAALPAIVTGSDPIDEDPIWTNYPDNLFSLLAPTHHLTVFESPTELCGVQTCGEGGPTEAIRAPAARYGDLYRDSFDVWRDRVSPGGDDTPRYDDFEERVDALADAPSADFDIEVMEHVVADVVGTTPSRLNDFVTTFTPSEKPTLYFLHLLLPHQPWIFYEDGTSYTVPVGDPAPGAYYPLVDVDAPTAWTLAVQQQRHILQAQYSDRLLGIVLDQLRSLGMYDDSLIVVVSDHGVAFRLEEPGGRPVSDAGLSSVAYAPLLVKAPGQREGRVSDENLMAIDVVPTLAAELGIDVPFEVDGHAAGSAAVADRGAEKYIFGFTGFLKLKLGEAVEFDAGAFRPRAEERWIGPIGPDDPILAGLHERLEVDVVGRRLADLDAAPGARAVVERLAEVTAPSAGGSPVGVVTGRITDGPVEGTVVVAVDGTIVAGSPLYEQRGVEGTFAALIPSDAIDGDGSNVIELAVVTVDGGAVRVDVEAS